MKRTKGPLVILDGNFICHRAKYALKGLSYEGHNTGILLGFLLEVQTLAFKFNTNDIVFVWDSKSSCRKDSFEGYKSSRNKKKDERTEAEITEDNIAYAMFNTIRRKVIPKLGFKNSFLQRSMEGDDLMAIIVADMQKAGDFRETIIVTGDMDLYQCIYPTCSMWNPGKNEMMTTTSFFEEYGIPPSKWGLVKQWGGCISDSVPGVPGIGVKKAIQYINGTMNKKTATYAKFAANKDIFDRNYELVVLPHKKTKSITLVENEFSMKGLKKVLKKYGLKEMVQTKSIKKWERLFENKFSTKAMRAGMFV